MKGSTGKILRQVLALVLLGLLAAKVSPRHWDFPDERPTKQSRFVSTSQSLRARNFGQLPLSFEVNRGQTDSQVKFLSRGSGYTLFLTSNEAVISLKQTSAASRKRSAMPSVGSRLQLARNSTALSSYKLLQPLACIPNSQIQNPPTSTTVGWEIVGANPRSKVTGLDELPGRSNYFIGRDPQKWRTDVPNYAKVRYAGVYPGVDLIYYGNQRHLEYDFVVAPDVDPNKIRLQFDGASKLQMDDKGALLIGSGREELRFEKPVVYQEVAERKNPVEANYVLARADRIGFRLGEYDRGRPVVIDPVLSYSTYLGGIDFTEGSGIALEQDCRPGQQPKPAGPGIGSADVDACGSAYVTGITDSPNFPTAHALQRSLGGPSALNAFVTKINPSGSALVYSTYLGGSGEAIGTGIAVDASGNVYVTGGTTSNDFPTTTGAFQPVLNGVENAFVAKINARGSALDYSTYLGGSNDDAAQGIALDDSRNAYVTGSSTSVDFPTTSGAFQTALRGLQSAFVAKINGSGSALVYSTYLGGSFEDYGQGIAVDAFRNAYVTGGAESDDFPTVNALQPSPGGTSNVFVSKINARGSALVYSTYLGGNQFDAGQGIAVDTSGDAYVTGLTGSNSFPTVHALQATLGGPSAIVNAFVTKINARGSALVYSTYLGGNKYDYGSGIALDASRNAYVTGGAESDDFPTADALQRTLGGPAAIGNAFVTKINANGSELAYSTYLGGGDFDGGIGIAVDASGNAYVTGMTESKNFPTVHALQRTLRGTDNAFIAKITDSDCRPDRNGRILEPCCGFIPCRRN